MLVSDINGNVISIENFNCRTHKYHAQSGRIVELNQAEKELFILADLAEKEKYHKTSRNKYLDAYRKYQAAVNYGEFERVPEIDFFIKRLRDKDWAAFDDIPAAIKYFTGECSFAESGLVQRP